MKPDYQIGIIGAGFAGLVAALRLKKNQHDSFVIFERATEVGGTWRDNVYPGCACDVASPLYSFADEPYANWSNMFGKQPEILKYMIEVVDKNDLRKHIKFNTNITNATFLPESGCWQINDNQNNTTTVKVLVAGLGPLNRPNIPKFEGMNDFKGKLFHSSEWDTNYDLTGKKVAVIGTGASAIQIVPNIIDTLASLTVFQRTPAWISDKLDMVFSEKSKQRFKQFPSLIKLQREGHFLLNEFFGKGFVGSKWLNKVMTWMSLQKLKNEVANPEIRKKLTPNYTIGCKRILRSNDFYPVFNRENVALVTDPIDTFTQNGIKTADGKEYIFDAVILGTGFHVADLNFPIRIIGKSGKSLIDVWKKSGGEAFMGTTVADFPNLTFILGPNTGLGHNSVIHIMESQMNYIMQYIQNIEKLGENGYLDVKQNVQDEYNQNLQKQFDGTVWVSGCQSWYMNGDGKISSLYPRLNTAFRKMTKVFNVNNYQAVT